MRKEIIAYAISHAPKGVKGGPYEGPGTLGDKVSPLSHAMRYADAADAYEDAAWLARQGHDARVIRIVRARLAASGPDPMPVVRAAMEETDAEEAFSAAPHCGRRGEAAALDAAARARVDAVDAYRGFVLREQAAPGTLAHLRADLRDMTARAERAEREREECESVLTAMGARAREAEEFARVLEVERDTARAELARLTAPAEGEPLDEALRDAFEVAYRDAASECHANAIRAIYRLGVAHERARQQPAQDRATAEELERVYSAAYARAWESEVSTPDRGERAGLRAVAAHVRQERCLVARAVDAHMSTHVYRRGPDDWAVALGPRFVECERADVPATLARLLGEVAT